MHATGLEHAPSSRLAGPSRSSGSPSSFRSLTGPPAGLKAPCLKPSKHVHADHRSVLVPSPTSSTITLNQPAGATSHHTRFNQVRNRSSWAKRASDCPEADVSRVRKGPRPEASRRGGLGLRQTKSYRYFKHISVRSFILNGAPSIFPSISSKCLASRRFLTLSMLGVCQVVDQKAIYTFKKRGCFLLLPQGTAIAPASLRSGTRRHLPAHPFAASGAQIRERSRITVGNGLGSNVPGRRAAYPTSEPAPPLRFVLSTPGVAPSRITIPDPRMRDRVRQGSDRVSALDEGRNGLIVCESGPL